MNKIRKALTAAAGSAVFALLGGLGVGLSDGHLTGSEVEIALGAAATAAAAVGRTVWRVPNNDAPDDPPA